MVIAVSAFRSHNNCGLFCEINAIANVHPMRIAFGDEHFFSPDCASARTSPASAGGDQPHIRHIFAVRQPVPADNNRRLRCCRRASGFRRTAHSPRPASPAGGSPPSGSSCWSRSHALRPSSPAGSLAPAIGRIAKMRYFAIRDPGFKLTASDQLFLIGQSNCR